MILVERWLTKSMQKILIIGCSGAGKSTFARRLHAVTRLPLIHLDQYYWKPNWVEPDWQEWRQTLAMLLEKPSWIMDGNFGGTMDLRIGKADLVIYLDFPAWLCLWRVLKRVFKYRGKERPDMPEGCREKWDIGFLHYVATFNLTRRKPLLAKLDTYRSEKEILVFTTDKQAADFLENLVKKQTL